MKLKEVNASSRKTIELIKKKLGKDYRTKVRHYE